MKKIRLFKSFAPLLFILVLAGALILSLSPLAVSAANEEAVQFTPQVGIPGSSFQGPTAISGDSIGKLAIAIYNYGLAIVGILAALVLMAGGVLWLTSAGNTSRIGQAKELMTGSLIGMLILTGAWLLLNTVNPNLTRFKSLDVTMINPLTIGSCCEYPDWTAKALVTQESCLSQQGRYYEKAKVVSKTDGSGAFCADTGCCRCKIGGSWETLWFSNSNCVDEKNSGGKVLPDACEIACEAAANVRPPVNNPLDLSWEIEYVWGQGCDEDGECSWGAEGGAGGEF